MVAKLKVFGFIAGAAVTAAGLTTLNAWRHVSDDDRLTAILADHCLPYVHNQTPPFTDIGRTPGVYDNVDVRDGVDDGGTRLLYNGRFVAQWGVLSNAGPSGDAAFRICNVASTYAAGKVVGFEVAPEDFINRYSRVVAPDGSLVPDTDSLTATPSTLGWYNVNGAYDDGLRVVMIASSGWVSSVLVTANLTP